MLAPSKPKEFSLYVHNLQNVKQWDRRVCHLSAGPRWCSHHMSKHQGCNTWSVPSSHISTSRGICRQIQRPAGRRGHLGARVSVPPPPWGVFTLHLCVWQNHSTQLVLIIIITARTGPWACLQDSTSSAGTFVDQDLSFLFYLFCFIISFNW